MTKLFLLSLTLLFTISNYAQGYWKRVHGDGITEAYSPVGTYATENSPHGKYALGCMVDSSGSFWTYEGPLLWRYNPAINQWMVSFEGESEPVFGDLGVESPTNNPGGVGFGHPSWGDHLGNLWMYGLNGFDDMWKYNISSGMWTRVRGSGSIAIAASYGVKGIPSATNSPGLCNETDCHWVDSEGVLWLYTEFNGNLWSFDPLIEMWTWIAGNGAAGATPVYGVLDVFDADNTPGVFSACPAVGTLYSMWITSDDHLWILANRFGGDLTTELWEFDPLLIEWRCRRIDISEFGFPQEYPIACLDDDATIHPIARSEMRVEWVDDCDRVYFFGGGKFCGLENGFNDIWRYDPTSNNYTYVKGGVDEVVPGIQNVYDEANIPSTSFGSQAWQNENGFYLMGGEGGVGSVYDNHLWNYIPDTTIAGFSFSVDCNTVSFVNTSETGCNSIKEINWDFGDGSFSDAINPTHVYTENGSYNVLLEVTNCSWHTDAISITVVVDCGFAIDLVGDTVCIGECATLIVSSFEDTDDIDFVWNNGIAINNDTVTVCPDETTLYMVIGTNVVGEIDTAWAEVFVVSPPIVDLGEDTVLCGGDLVLDAENIGSFYSWQDGSTEQYFNVVETGLYWVTVNNGGCETTDTISVVIEGPIIDLGNDTTICVTESLLLNPDGDDGLFIWQDGSTESSYLVDASGVYWVTVTDGECSNTDTIHVMVDHPIAQFSVSDTIGCTPFAVNFTDFSVSDYPITSWLWNFGDGTTSSEQNPSHIYSESGVYSVTLQVLTVNGCYSDTLKNVTVEVYDYPIANFSFIPEFPAPGVEVLFENESEGALSWEWNFEDGANSSDENPTHTFEAIGNYNVTLVVSNNFCSDEHSKYIVIEEDLVFYVPNAFTPDGDNLNNTFYPVFQSGFNPYDYHLTIFNRWGAIIFESYNWEVGWDGSIPKCGIIQDGVYVWQIEVGVIGVDDRKMYRGHVTLLH